MFDPGQTITQGGPAVIILLVSIGGAAWGLLATGVLRFGRECEYRDQIIANLTKVNEELRAANNGLIDANRQQAIAAQAADDLIRQELLPRLVPRGA